MRAPGGVGSPSVEEAADRSCEQGRRDDRCEVRLPRGPPTTGSTASARPVPSTGSTGETGRGGAGRGGAGPGPPVQPVHVQPRRPRRGRDLARGRPRRPGGARRPAQCGAGPKPTTSPRSPTSSSGSPSRPPPVVSAAGRPVTDSGPRGTGTSRVKAGRPQPIPGRSAFPPQPCHGLPNASTALFTTPPASSSASPSWPARRRGASLAAAPRPAPRTGSSHVHVSSRATGPSRSSTGTDLGRVGREPPRPDAGRARRAGRRPSPLETVRGGSRPRVLGDARAPEQVGRRGRATCLRPASDMSTRLCAAERPFDRVDHAWVHRHAAVDGDGARRHRAPPAGAPPRAASGSGRDEPLRRD